MRAAARVVAEADRAGTRLTVLHSDVPVVLRRTGPEQVHLVGGAAGPLGGDAARLTVEVGPGAALCLRTVAASVALPGQNGAESRLTVRASVAAGGRLAWLPEPLVAAAGCRHEVRCAVTLAEDALLLWRDELVFGRAGEGPGDAAVETVVTRAGRPLLHHRLAVGPSAPGWNGPAVLGGAKATGSLLVVEPAWTAPPPPRVLGPNAAVLPLAGPAVLATVVAADASQVRRCLDGVMP